MQMYKLIQEQHGDATGFYYNLSGALSGQVKSGVNPDWLERKLLGYKVKKQMNED